MDVQARIWTALDGAAKVSRKVKVAKPPSASRLAQLVEEAGPVGPELEAYFACCNGAEVSGEPGLWSIEQMLDLDTPGYFAIRDDGCGNHDLVAPHFAVGAGCVVFRDHETEELSHLVASSLTAFVDLWSIGARAAARGQASPTLVKWPHDPMFMAEHDPPFAKLARSARFKKQLGPVALELVDRKGRIKERRGMNPFTRQEMVIPAPPRTRRRP